LSSAALNHSGKTPRVNISENEHKKGTISLRKGRHSQHNQIYHITSTTRQRHPYLRRFQQGRYVVNAFRREDSLGSAKTLAFVVMPDHFHWLVAQGVSSTLSTVVSNVKSLSARWINHSLERSGPIWQPGFYDRAIRRDEDIAAVARYIVANPLRAGLVDRIGDYPLWDSVWL
jgi:REP element-mobilizing transposase RayT